MPTAGQLSYLRAVAESYAKADRRRAIVQRLVAQGMSYSAIGKQIGVSRQRVWQMLNPSGHAAQCATNKAIAAGKLSKPSLFKCEDCGSPATQYDHRDYAERLTVSPVCNGCNKKRGPAKAGPSRREYPPVVYESGVAVNYGHMKIKFSFPPPSQMVKELTKAGWTQEALAQMCGCQQPMISRMKSGMYADVTYAVGRKLEYLWANKVSPPEKMPAR
jgi:hypothetical protein